jgi:cytochrome P450
MERSRAVTVSVAAAAAAGFLVIIRSERFALLLMSILAARNRKKHGIRRKDGRETRILRTLGECRAVLSSPDFSAAPARLRTAQPATAGTSFLNRLLNPSAAVAEFLASRVALVRLSRRMLLYDDARHMALKRTVYPVLLSRQHVEEALGEIVTEHIRDLAEGIVSGAAGGSASAPEPHQFDAVRELCEPLPWRLAQRLTGFPPPEDVDLCTECSLRIGKFVGEKFTVGGLRSASADLRRLRPLFDRWIASVPKSAGPIDGNEEADGNSVRSGRDVTGLLAEPLFFRWFRAREHLWQSRDDLHGNIVMFLFAATHNLTNVLANGMRLLFAHPEQLEKLRSCAAGDLDALLDDFVDEVIRVNPPIRLIPRTAMRDVELVVNDVGGDDGQQQRTIRCSAGEQVLLSVWDANRDASFGPDAGVFDIDRPRRTRLAFSDGAPSRHIGFGTGPHSCMGNALGRVALRGLVRDTLLRGNSNSGLLPNLRLARGATCEEPADWVDSSYTKVEKLVLEFDLPQKGRE